MVTIKKLLVNLRKESKESRSKMARRLGITQSFLYRVEIGERNFSEITLGRLFEKYKIPEEEREQYIRLMKLNSFSVLIDLKNIKSLSKREIIILLSENLEDLSERTARSINIIIKRDLGIEEVEND